MTAHPELELAPTEAELALANGNPPRLVRYDPSAPGPEYRFEVVNDYIVRKPVGWKEMRIAAILDNALAPAVRAAGVGRSYQGMGYDLPGGGRRPKPDVSVLSFARWPDDRDEPDGDFVPAVPELAVEVVSPHELADTVFGKVAQYFRAGVAAVWIVLPRVGQVHCYDSPTAVRVLTRADELTGDPVVPGFRLPVADLFPPSAPTP
ncbi:MAG: Uma2 family endonuclease [Gemmataceae bacterium]|nr:Uma2 family endonuclease [Gemmataceae bacterium]